MNAKELKDAKQKLGGDILALIQKFHDDTGGYRVYSLHLHTVATQTASEAVPTYIPSGIYIGIDI